MSASRLLANLLIIAAGPGATIFFYASKGFPTERVGLFVVWILVLSAITAGVGILLNLVIRHPLLAALPSAFISEMLYIVVLWLLILSTTKIGVERSESMVWFPVAIMLLIPMALPTAITVSYGTGRIVKDWQSFKRRDRALARNLARALVENWGETDES